MESISEISELLAKCRSKIQNVVVIRNVVVVLNSWLQDKGDGGQDSAESRSRMRLWRRAVMLGGFKYACAIVASPGRRKKAGTTE